MKITVIAAEKKKGTYYVQQLFVARYRRLRPAKAQPGPFLIC